MSLTQHTHKPGAPGSRNDNDTFFKSRVQAKLAIGQPGDKYEVEADRTADSVVSRLKAAPQSTPVQPGFFNPKPVVQPRRQEVQKKDEADGKAGEDKEIQEKPLATAITPLQLSELPEEQPVQEKCDACGSEEEKQPVQSKCADCEAKEREAIGSGVAVQQKCDACAAAEEKQPVQAKCTSCGEHISDDEPGEHPQPVQAKCAKCEQEGAVQRKGGKSSGKGISEKLSASKGSGYALKSGTQEEMSRGFGTDFSGVRIHTDSNAVQMNKELGSQAFTNGSDIYFNSGKYDPDSDSGRHLLAHELTHTVQQGAVSGAIAKKEQPAAQPESVNETPAKETEPSGDEPGNPVVLKDAVEVAESRLPASATPEASADPATVAPDVASEKAKGDAVIAAKVPDAAAVEDKKKQEKAGEEADAGKEKKEKKDDPAAGKKKKKKTGKKKRGARGKKKNPAAAVRAELHELAPLAGLLEEPKAKQDTAHVPVQMKPEDDHQPETVDPAEYVGRISAANETNVASVTLHAETLLGNINRKGEEMKAAIYADIQNAILATQAKFMQARTDLTTGIQAAETAMNTDLETKIAAATADGVATKAEIETAFGSHLTNIDTTVNTNIAAVSTMDTHYRGEMDKGVEEQVGRARAKRDAKNAGFENSERGDKQREAVSGVVNGMVNDMVARKPSMVASISEIIQPIPEEFRNKGTEAKSGVTDNKNQLLTDVETRVQEIITQMRSVHQESLRQLRDFDRDMQKELSDQETYTVQQLEGLLPGVDRQVAEATEAAVAGLETTKTHVVTQLNTKAQETIAIIHSSAPTSDAASMDAFCETMLGFLNGVAAESMSSMTEGTQLMDEQALTIGENVTQSISALGTSTDSMITTFTTNVSTSLTGMQTGHTQNLDSLLTTMTQGFDDLLVKIGTELAKSIQELQTGFTKTLDEAEGKIREAIQAGLAKNEEAISGLDGKINEAASDAGWRYDHPVLAGIADVASFVGGLILGILFVLALVVVAIVAFKLLLAGLVAAGIALVVAKIIVLVVALVVLGIGIYRAYSARRSAGQGGWASFGMALLDVTGITAIYRGATQQGLSPFERGFLIGEGIATIASFFLARKIDGAISGKLPPSIANPGGVNVSGVGGRSGSGAGTGNGGGAQIIPFRPRATTGVPGSGGSGGGVVASSGAFEGSAARQLAPAVRPQAVPIVEPQPGVVIPFPRPAAATVPAASGGTSPVAGAGAAAGVNPANQPATKKKHTCPDSVLERLRGEKNQICKSIPKGDCGVALTRLKNDGKLSGSVKNLSRAAVLAKIAGIQRCIDKRWEVQNTCFGGVPDDDHEGQFAQLETAKKKCEDLIAYIDNLLSRITLEEKSRMNLNNW